MFPKTIPANKSPNAQIKSAIKLSLITELCSEMKSGNEDSELRIFFFFVFAPIMGFSQNQNPHRLVFCFLAFKNTRVHKILLFYICTITDYLLQISPRRRGTAQAFADQTGRRFQYDRGRLVHHHRILSHRQEQVGLRQMTNDRADCSEIF